MLWGHDSLVLIVERYLDAWSNLIPLQAKPLQEAVGYIDIYHAQDSISLPDIVRDRVPRISSWDTDHPARRTQSILHHPLPSLLRGNFLCFPKTLSKFSSSQANHTSSHYTLTPTCPNAPTSSAQPAYSSPRSPPPGIPHREWHRPIPNDYILAPPSS